jgi:putative ABC transport system substrate-binding protein
MMNRRAFLTTVGVGVAAVPLVAEAQQTGKVWRVGVVMTLPRRPAEVFVEELRELGYREGENILIEWQHTEGLLERRRLSASALLQWKPDVIMAIAGVDAMVMREMGVTVPIVVALAGDLVGMGLATSLARPGGTVTGFQMLSLDLMTKRLEVLREIVPKLHRLALLHQGGTPAGPIATAARAHTDRIYADVEAAASALSITVQRFPVATPDDFDRTFADMRRERVQAAIAPANTLFGAHVDRLAELCLRHRFPVMYETKTYVEAGSLISYGMRPSDGLRAAARYVDKILKGATPGELPIEQPRQFEMVINLKTAKALGLTIPRSLLLRADRVIQ